MKVGGFNLYPEQTGGVIKGTNSPPGSIPIQQQIYGNLNETISNNTGPVGFTHNFVLAAPPYTAGGTLRFRFFGITSCTGTPTLRLQPYWTSGSNIISDSGAYTLPSNLSGGTWQVAGVWTIISTNLLDFGSVFYMPSGTGIPPSDSVVIQSNQGSTTFTGTGPIGLQIRFSAADPANTITLLGASMDYYPPLAHS